MANLSQNSITAVQSVLNIVHWVIDQTASEAYIDLEDLGTLQEILADGQALAWDVASLQAQIDSLFGLDGAPASKMELTQRMADIRVVMFQTWSYAVRTQTLLNTAVNTINHALGLFEGVMGAIGGLSAQQTLGQAQLKLVQLQTELKVQTTAFQRAQSVEHLRGPMIEQALQNIDENITSDHPRW